MRARLTVVSAGNHARADVVLEAGDQAPAAEVLSALRTVVGADAVASITVGGCELAATGEAIDAGICDGVTVVVGGTSGAEPDGPACTLEVAAGPDSGRIVRLRSGRYVIGRGRAGETGLHDAAVSREHAAIDVADGSAGAATLTDLGSANGTAVDGIPVVAGLPVPLRPGSWIDLGDSRVRVTASTPGRRGPGVVHRPPRPRPAPRSERVEFPESPAAPPRTRIPLLATTVPLLGGIALAAVLRQWQFLAFTALSPVMMLAQAASDRRSGRRAARAAQHGYAEAMARATARLDALVAAERLDRYAAAPDLAALAAAAATRDPVLWSREVEDDDALAVRIGRAELPSDITVVRGPAASVPDVPVVVRLRTDSPLGVCGAAASTGGLVRSLVIQAATLHGPGGLRIVVLAPGAAADWAWATWLPHLRVHDSAAAARIGVDDVQIAARIAEISATGAADRGHTLVVVDESAARLPSSARLALADLTSSTIGVIWRTGDALALPSLVASVVTVTEGRPRATIRRADGTTIAHVRLDLIAVDIAEVTARALAPLRDGAATRSAVLPTAVRWADLERLDLRDQSAAADTMRRLWFREPSTEVGIGRSADGRFALDLCADGPHALIAGTTGSGKSELLLTLVAGLAARNRPDRLALLLIDHKGGATFGRCAALPHTVGVITDLEPESTRRALLSLTAELRRRETRFAAAGVADFTSHAAIRGPADQLARLVIVVDEFATLADEQPDFVDGLVGIARRGRSLGVHLVLATQRPEGVVSADIRANTRLRICLAVARENESRDVIDSPVAATISAGTPGRAFAKIGPDPAVELHTARVTVVGEPAGVQVTLSPASTLGDPPPVEAAAAERDTDLDILVAAATDLAGQLGLRTSTAPWLPPLPHPLAMRGPDGGADLGEICWGMVDLPTDGTQRPLTLDLRGGSAAVIAGSARSGRTTAARTIALAATTRLSPDQLHLWAIDATGDLADLATLPHCGAVVTARERDRLDLLLDYLGAEIGARRRTRDSHGPTLMLLVDSWDGVCAAAERRDPGAVSDRLLRLATDGPAAGLHVIVTSERSGLSGRLAAVCPERIALRLADPSDLALIGLPARDLPRDLPPGRGYRASDRALVQVALADNTDLVRARRWPQPAHGVRRFDPLPDRVPLGAVRTVTDAIGLGLQAGDLAPIALRRSEIGAGFLVAGPPGAGRSSVLALLGRQLHGRPLVVCGPMGSPVLDQHDAIRLPMDDPDAATRLDALLSSDRPPDLLVDDVDRLDDGPLRSLLERLLATPSDQEQVIALAGTTEAMAVAFRGPVALAKRRRHGLLLCPMGPHDGDLFGVRLPPRSGGDDPPGRGWLIRRGRAVGLQVANPRDETDQPAEETRTSADRACSAE